MKTARRKRESRKFQPRDEFRINNSPASKGHPDYVFGYKNGKYRSFGLTHSPKPEYRSSQLKINPKPSDSRSCYLQYKVKITQERYMSKPLTSWSLHKEDRPLVRHLIKQYKKRQNKKRR